MLDAFAPRGQEPINKYLPDVETVTLGPALVQPVPLEVIVELDDDTLAPIVVKSILWVVAKYK